MIPLSSILFLDIETVPLNETFSQLSDVEKNLWAKKTERLRKDEISAEEYYERAGIWAEFGKIVCIGVGFFSEQNNENHFRIKVLQGAEVELLKEFSELLSTNIHEPKKGIPYLRFPYLCAHNGKEFDFPYICRRMIINSIKLPTQLDIASKKPWEVNHLDTLKMWSFGDYKNYTSLELIAQALSIESPKGDLDGSKVFETYYKAKNLEKIYNYCIQDVKTLFEVYLRIQGIGKNYEVLKI